MRAPAPSVGDAVAKLSLSPGSNFFSSGLRQKVDQLMDILYAGGVNNPMDSIEQISYLLFIVRSTGDVRGHKQLEMSALTGYAVADGATDTARGQGNDTQGSDRASDCERAELD